MASIDAVVILCNGSTDQQRTEIVSVVPRLSERGVRVRIAIERHSFTVTSDLEGSATQTSQFLNEADLEWDESLQTSLSLAQTPLPNIALVVSERYFAYLQRAHATLECRTFVLGDNVHPKNGDDNTEPTVISSLSKLEQLIPLSHKTCHGTLLVGYILNQRREAERVKLGLLRLVDADGLCFSPVEPDIPFEQQGPFDAVLHKTSQGQPLAKVVYGAQQYCSTRGIPLIDTPEAVQLVGDRMTLCGVLSSLEEHVCGTSGTRVRGVKYAQVSSLSDIHSTLESSSITLPCLVKAQQASGSSSAHSMALLCRSAGVAGLQVSMPACLQEFLDHDALVHKVWVIGEQVFTSQRKSIPNMRSLLGRPMVGSRVPDVVNFSSQKNVFVSLFDGLTADDTQPQPCVLDVCAIESAAGWLREHLGLTLFGFDVLVDHNTGDHVVVDVNYFPSFGDVKAAAVHLRSAIKGVITAARECIRQSTRRGETGVQATTVEMTMTQITRNRGETT